MRRKTNENIEKALEQADIVKKYRHFDQNGSDV